MVCRRPFGSVSWTRSPRAACPASPRHPGRSTGARPCGPVRSGWPPGTSASAVVTDVESVTGAGRVLPGLRGPAALSEVASRVPAMAPTALSPSRAAGLHAVPAALPLPRGRPAPRAAESGGGPRHRRARRAGAPVRPARRRADRCARRPMLVPAVGAGPRRAEPELADLFDGDDGRGERLAGRRRGAAGALVRRWRTRPGWSRPSASCTSRRPSTSGCMLRGYVDRLDVAPDGRMRVVDYKTGQGARSELFEAKALFQMKFYALVLWRLHGRVPRRAPAGLPGQRRGAALRPRRGRPAGHRAQGQALWAAIERAARDRRLAAAPEPAVRLVRPPAAVPRSWRHPPAATRRRRRAGRRPERRPCPARPGWTRRDRPSDPSVGCAPNGVTR